MRWVVLWHRLMQVNRTCATPLTILTGSAMVNCYLCLFLTNEETKEKKESSMLSLSLYVLKDARSETGLAACMSIFKKLW